MRTPRSNKTVRRGKANREKGIRFERRIRRLLEIDGIRARRVLEYDGTRKGCDIEIVDSAGRGYGEVAIQCKATKNPKDLLHGLEEAILHNPHSKLFIALHTYNRQLFTLCWQPPDPPAPQEWSRIIEAIATLCPDARITPTVHAAAASFKSQNFQSTLAGPQASVPTAKSVTIENEPTAETRKDPND